MFSPKLASDYVMLREAIKKKDRVTARKLILNNASVNLPHARGASPLHWAIIKFDDLEIITMLVEKGANIFMKDHRRQTPLEVAILNNKVQAAIFLIKKGALIDQNLNSLLVMAIEKNKNSMMRILIDYGIKHNPSIDLNVALNAAICQGQLEIMKAIKPHCRFSKPSDRYIPGEVVIRSSQKYKECVELLLQWNFTVNPNSNQDKSFVYAAVENGYLKIVLELLKFGIDVNMVNLDTKISLLKIACYRQYYEIVQNLLEHNACVNLTTPTDMRAINSFSSYHFSNHMKCPWMSSVYLENILSDITCLHIAVLNQDPIMTLILLKYGAKIVDDLKYFNITCIAIQNNCKEIVRIFLDHGVDVTDIDAEGKSLLHLCINNKSNGQDSRYGIAKLLLDYGANILIQVPNNTFVFEAIENGHRKIAQLFLDYQANIQYTTQHGDTLLHKAIEKDCGVEFIKTLLKLHSPVNATNNNIFTPLLVACKTPSMDQFEIIKALLQNNADIHCAANISAVSKSLTDFRISIEYGFDFSTINIRSQTPLHIVCSHKHNKIDRVIQLLLQHNANIEAADIRGWTPLFIACEAANHIAAKCLLDNNANASHTDKRNLTPLYIAAKNCKHSSEIVKMLLERKVNVHCIDNLGKSIIHLVVENNNVELIKTLAHTQVNFNSVNKQGNTPLHIAIMKESVEMTQNLIKYGANVNIIDKNRQTPLGSAIKYKSDYQRQYDDYQERQDNYWHRSYSSENSDGFDIDGFTDDINKYKKIIKILKTQIVKLKTAKLRVNKQNLNIIDNDDDDSDHDHSDLDGIDEFDALELEEKCEQEIEKMKMEKVNVGKMTFYDLLKNKIHYLSRFVKNKQVKQTLKLEVYNEKFPLYMDIIRSRFRDAKLRYRFVNAAKRYFSLNICPEMADECIDAIFSHLMIKDIKTFIRTMKPLKK